MTDKESGRKRTDKPWLQSISAIQHDRTAIVIGAGMAGAATARSLAERGWQVTVLDKHPQPAREASGNPQGMLYTRLSPNPTPLTQLVIQGYRHTLNLLQQAPEEIYQLCGLVQLPDSEKEKIRQQKLVDCGRYQALMEGMTAAQLTAKAGITVEQDGLFFPDGGWLKPPAFVGWLLEHDNIRFQGDSEVKTLHKVNDSWQLTMADNRTLSTTVVVIACGHHTSTLAQTKHLPLKAIRGQVTVVPATEQSMALRTVVCEDGYIAPASNGKHTLGATFHFDDPDQSCRASDHQLNLDNIANFAPALAEMLNFSDLDTNKLEGKTGYRCTTPDYLPMVGPLMDADLFRERFAALARNAKTRVEEEIPWLDGLYINTGHGSRGLITAPLSGDIVASQICGAPAPIPAELSAELHPGRFLARELIRGR